MSNSSSSGGVPPGFRFHPTDEELLHYYLTKKVSFQKFDMEVIREIDLNKMEPWELQERCRIGSTPQNEWYFFSHKDRKYPTGSRTNRATNAGFWKATGRDKCIRNTFKKIGMRKTLVFYRGRAPHGQKTDWIMHEYRLEDGDDPQANLSSEDGWVICRVFKKKNLFKVGNSEGGSSSMNSSDHQQLNNNNNNHTSSSNQARAFMHSHRDNQQYLLRQQAFELNNVPSSLHYAHLQPALPPHHYSLFQSQVALIPTHKPLVATTAYDYDVDSSAGHGMAKQLMTNPRDCESAGSESLRGYDPELEVGTCGPNDSNQALVATGGGGRDDAQGGPGTNEWTMLDRLVTSHDHHHLGNNEQQDHEDENPTSINHLTLRGEMDFWGYSK